MHARKIELTQFDVTIICAAHELGVTDGAALAASLGQ